MSVRDTVDATLERLVNASTGERVAISVAALVTAIIVGGLVVTGAGWVATCSTAWVTLPGIGSFCYDPFRVYKYLFVGSFASPDSLAFSAFNLAITLQETTILLIAGLSVAVAFRSGMFNIGAQGQLVLGALASALAVIAAGPFVPGGLVGTLVLVPLAVLVGAVVGGAYGAIPGALKAYADANEVITTIMLNFIAANLAFVLVTQVFQDPGSQAVQTRAIPEAARLDPVLSAFSAGSRFSIVVLLGAMVLAVGVYWLLTQTSFGYDLRTSGIQPKAAEYGGVDSKRTMVSSMALSGAISGVAGAIYILMVLGKYQDGVPSFGFDGITVSILAGNNPLAVLPAALLFGVLKGGSIAIEFGLEVPPQLVDVLRGLIILFVAMPEFFRMLGLKLGLGSDATATGGESE
ncbi:ABC transporter permease [Halocalculus aciditolerans]|uniref:ABC transporter permease n=1 Tax=Halocalculus aciditolerans TaxID=1383812 RepID=A0A830FJP1_9EURY|nr:ABC transporter permease [Halocalculus aciditolerans]GGL59146.1 ABC transporter permease [Halocalculus aciditolerans]